MKTFTFTLTVPESKRLIAKGLHEYGLIKKALKDHCIIVAGGTTNAYVYEELTGVNIMDKSQNTAGITTQGVICVTSSATRRPSAVIKKGKVQDITYTDALEYFTSNDVFIKGANCFDNDGNVGILIAGDKAGTIGKAYGTIVAEGAKLIIATGHEKLIPSVKEAAKYMGKNAVDYSLGMKCGLYVISDAIIFTEISALKTLFDIDIIVISSGGVNDCRGSVTFLARGKEKEIKKCFMLIKQIKGEPNIHGSKRSCGECGNKCQRIKAIK